MYAHMGTSVTLLQRSRRIAPEEEPVISDELRKYLEEEGIRIHTSVQVKRIYSRDGGTVVRGSHYGKTFEARGETFLLATGREPNTRNLWPRASGSETRAGWISEGEP